MEEKKNLEVNPAHKLLGRLQENRNSLFIKRVPEDTKKKFVELADRDFMGDYGFLLKWFVDDIMSQDTRVMIATLENHEARLIDLESKKVKQEPEYKSIKMCDGSKRRKVV